MRKQSNAVYHIMIQANDTDSQDLAVSEGCHIFDLIVCSKYDHSNFRFEIKGRPPGRFFYARPGVYFCGGLPALLPRGHKSITNLFGVPI